VETLSAEDMKYIAVAFAIGIFSGLTYVSILFLHVLPYMRRQGFVDSRNPLEACRINKAVSEYLKIDDPEEKNTKFLLKLLQIPFIIACLIVVFGIYAASRTNMGK